MAHGGRRPGAGRPPGAQNKTRRAAIEGWQNDGLELPLARLLRRSNDPSVPEPYRDVIAQWLLPYFHARVGGGGILSPRQMSDVQLAQAVAMAEEEQNYPRRLRLLPGGRRDA